MYKQPYVIPDIEIEREGNQLLIFAKRKLEVGCYQLFVGKTASRESINQLIAENKDGEFSIDLPVAGGPYYFVIKNEEYQTNIFSERVLQLNKAINIRDMGGYETYDGRVVKWGLLFRGDHLTNLDEADVQFLEKMNIRTIVDYRSDHEQIRYPSKKIRTVKHTYQCDPKSSFSECSAKAADLKNENINMVDELIKGEINPRYVNDKGENVMNGYKELVTSETARKAYSTFLKICADPQNLPLLHHCRGGKDRTGLGAMFLLLLLGVKEEHIIQDYILTGIIREDRNKVKYKQYRALTQDENHLAYLMTILATREEFIQASIRLIKEMYGSAEKYMIEHLNISKADITRMKAFYLEEAVPSLVRQR